ncbi:hypothetical protein EYF80_015319 [Liparis tanakae]|uniref:Uncharacterized protein n=1 Tax=Liparis tanakae TaxID=230148 RepID=A0A4Z2I8Y7_9TELE|nr:hypothetical protein EYF80_015319 [Liparis tanakae]
MVLLRDGLALAISPIITEPVHPDEAVVENSLCALHSLLGLVWGGKLDQCPFWVILEGHLSKKTFRKELWKAGWERTRWESRGPQVHGWRVHKRWWGAWGRWCVSTLDWWRLEGQHVGQIDILHYNGTEFCCVSGSCCDLDLDLYPCPCLFPYPSLAHGLGCDLCSNCGCGYDCKCDCGLFCGCSDRGTSPSVPSDERQVSDIVGRGYCSWSQSRAHFLKYLLLYMRVPCHQRPSQERQNSSHGLGMTGRSHLGMAPAYMVVLKELNMRLLGAQNTNSLDEVIDHFVHAIREDRYIAGTHDELPEHAPHLQPIFSLTGEHTRDKENLWHPSMNSIKLPMELGPGISFRVMILVFSPTSCGVISLSGMASSPAAEIPEASLAADLCKAPGLTFLSSQDSAKPLGLLSTAETTIPDHGVLQKPLDHIREGTLNKIPEGRQAAP